MRAPPPSRTQLPQNLPPLLGLRVHARGQVHVRLLWHCPDSTISEFSQKPCWCIGEVVAQHAIDEYFHYGKHWNRVGDVLSFPESATGEGVTEGEILAEWDAGGAVGVCG